MALNLPAVTDDFVKSALALPDAIDPILSQITDPGDVVDLIDQTEAREHFARRLKMERPVINALVCTRLKEMAGWALLTPPEKGGRGKTSAGGAPVFSKHTVASYRKVGDHVDKITDYWRWADEEDAVMSPKQFLDYVGSGDVIATRHGNLVVEWYTPEEYIEAARKAMGSIDTDPASSKVAQKMVKADTFHTAADSGLDYDWLGNVFMNPPFKMPDVSDFVNKLCDEVDAGNVKQAVLLTNNNTDTGWWQRAATASKAICFTAGRISFYNSAGDFSSPTNGQTFIYFGRRVRSFCAAFAAFGLTLETPK